MASISMQRFEEILRYWFGELSDGKLLTTTGSEFQFWFGKDPAIDREIRERFEADYVRAAQGELASWAETPRGRLALLLLLDQFPRNMYRGTARAFDTDSVAQPIARRALATAQSDGLALVEWPFLLLPLVHAEDLLVQEEALAHSNVLIDLARTRSPHNVQVFQQMHERHAQHRDIIARFGRFPHRNAFLGRASTPEELAFLELPGSSF